MKKLLAGLAVLSLFAAIGYAAQVNPTSNVLGDTAATANTLVYRDANGVFSAASLEDGTVVTAKLGANSVITAKTYLDLATERLLCVKTNKQIGQCANTADTSAAGRCNCQ